MWLGLSYAISACFVWGAIFVIPHFLTDFSSIEVVLGRYLTYGLLSCVLFFRKGFARARLVPRKAWAYGGMFALISNFIYYLGVISGVRFASAPLTVLLIGMAPIVITLYGNWHTREVSFKQMIFPCFWIALGMVLVNVTGIDWTFESHTLQQYIIGLLGVMAALFGWSWYAVTNARFLKRYPNILSTEWSTIIGVCTFFMSIIMGLCFYREIDIVKFTQWSPEIVRFVIGALILGVCCSWVGCYCWNRASMYLPVSLMGPFLIFESIFGLLFVYTVDLHLPSLLEMVGMVSMLSGILLSIMAVRKRQSKVVQ